MRLAVGYQLAEPDEPSFVDLVRDYQPHVAEVYFAWVQSPSGRSAVGTDRGCTDWSAQSRMEADLVALRDMGVELDLLLNANCYGDDAVSQRLENEVGSLLAHLHDLVGGVDLVTTASPFIARTVRQHFPDVRTRASVNMRIGSAAAMALVADLFDGFCIQRDVQRDIAHLRRLRRWADAAGKSLCLLANSGCLHECPNQTFHDNLVAHEQAVAERKNVTGWNPILCRRLMRDRAHWPATLQSTWIRPEDLHHYEGLVDVVKLATRMHDRPRLVVDAYASRRFRGNLLDLMEPAFSPAFAPCAIDNERFPDDWFDRTSTCEHHCEACGYCAAVLQRVLTPMPQQPATVS